MKQAQFEAMVARLEIESRASPGAYQTRVALLALLGFGGVAAIVGLAGLGLVLSRRVRPADARVRTFVLAVEFSAWARWRSKVAERIAKLAAHEWPVHVILTFVWADDKDLLPRLRALGRSEIARP